MISVIIWELTRRKWLFFWWSVGVALLTSLTVLPYGSLREQSAELDKALEGFGDNAGSFFGSADIFSPVGYLNSQLNYIVLPILFIILGVTLARALLSKEEADHTLELLLARPISRVRLLSAKALSGLLIILGVGAVATMSTAVAAQVVDLGIPLSHLLGANVGTLLFSASFAAISFGLAAASQITQRFAGVAAVLLSFGSYIITSLGNNFDWLETISKALPYYYYDSEQMLQGSWPLGFVVSMVVVFGASLVVGVLGFKRRDIA